jgi:hypothetical protein
MPGSDVASANVTPPTVVRSMLPRGNSRRSSGAAMLFFSMFAIRLIPQPLRRIDVLNNRAVELVKEGVSHFYRRRRRGRRSRQGPRNGNEVGMAPVRGENRRPGRSYSAWVGWGVRSAGGDRLICDESRGVLFSLV